MVAGECSVTGEGGGFVDCVESCGRAVDHADGDCAIECDDGRWIELQQGVVEKNDAVPLGLFGGAGAHVTGGNGCLQRVRFRAAAQSLRLFERGHSSLDLRVVPQGAVLIRE